MPLIKRLVEPVHINRAIVPQHVNNELEFVSTSALSNIMRQLGTLSAHADDLFSELHRDATSLLYRVGLLAERVERVQSRIVKLNPIVEEVSLQDINMRKPFKSSIIKDQQVITKSSRPQSVMLMYQHYCEPAPALHILNPYREDGRDSVKFYTDPDYFLELWCLEIAKDTENQMKRHKQRGRRTARPSKEPRSIRAPKSHHTSYAEMRHGPEFVDNLRRNHPASRQTEPHSPKTDLRRTGSLQQPSSEVRRWNANAGAPNEHLVYPQSTAANQAHVFSHENVAARNGGTDIHQSLHAVQPTRAASMRQTTTRYEAPADNMISGGSTHPPGPLPSLSNASYLGNSNPPTSTVDAIRSGMPVSSAAQQVTADEHRSLRDSSFDLPAPPTPPSSSVVPSSLSGDRLPSPPMMVTPPPDADGHFSGLPLPQYLPPPELVTNTTSSDTANPSPTWHNTDVSNVSTAVIDNGSDAQQTDDVLKNDTPLVRDTRSDLLAAIREGIQLRKVEERRQKSAQKQQQHASSGTGRLDVQAIMEAAFEMRRKALEENDSEEDDDADGRWSDND